MAKKWPKMPIVSYETVLFGISTQFYIQNRPIKPSSLKIVYKTIYLLDYVYIPVLYITNHFGRLHALVETSLDFKHATVKPLTTLANKVNIILDLQNCVSLS